MQLHYQGREDQIPLWWQTRNVTPKADAEDQSFFTNSMMGIDTFSDIVSRAVTDSGLEVGERDIANSSLRSSAFNIQENVGLDGVQRQSFSGHVNDTTSIHYLRRNEQKNYTFGAKVVEAITGKEVIEVDFDSVLLTNGFTVKPMKYEPPKTGKKFKGNFRISNKSFNYI